MKAAITPIAAFSGGTYDTGCWVVGKFVFLVDCCSEGPVGMADGHPHRASFLTTRQLLNQSAIPSSSMLQVVGFADRDTFNMKLETPNRSASRFTVQQAHGPEFYRRANDESCRSGVFWGVGGQRLDVKAACLHLPTSGSNP